MTKGGEAHISLFPSTTASDSQTPVEEDVHSCSPSARIGGSDVAVHPPHHRQWMCNALPCESKMLTSRTLVELHRGL